jgi:hypothetical protein
VLLELFLFGSGRILEFGPITLRMILYILCMFSSAVFLLYCNPKLNKQIFGLLLFFMVVTSVGLLVGVLNNAPVGKMAEDIKPLMYFFMSIFFYLTIQKVDDLKRIVKLLKLSSLVLGAGYLSLLVLIYFKIIDFSKFYIFLSELSDDFPFRQNRTFFYKGFLFLCIGLIFYSLDRKLISRVISLILLIAIFLTFTRGFILSLAIVFMFFTLFMQRNPLVKVSLIALCIVLSPYLVRMGASLFDKTNESNAGRLIQLAQVAERVDSSSVFVGHGFGIGVPIKPIHMEISFLEIFHKQGLLGIMFWVVLLAIIVHRYAKIRSYPYKRIALGFLLSSIFIYIQSQTNPFLNNPIGMSFLLISVISLKVLRDEECYTYRYAWPHTTAKNISTPSLNQY